MYFCAMLSIQTSAFTLLEVALFNEMQIFTSSQEDRSACWTERNCKSRLLNNN